MEIFGIIAGTLTTGAFFPQVYRTVKTRSAKDLSWLWLAMMSVGVLSWTAYGITLNSLPMMIANVITFVCLLIIIWVKWKTEK